MPYEYVEDLTAADIAFEAKGKTIEEMFESAGLAVTNTMSRDPSKIEPKVTKTIIKTAENVEKLLFDFLEELIFLKDAEQLLFSKFNVKVEESEGKYSATIEAFGEEIDPERHELVIDAKAITMHKYEVEKTEEGWRAQVIVDV